MDVRGRGNGICTPLAWFLGVGDVRRGLRPCGGVVGEWGMGEGTEYGRLRLLRGWEGGRRDEHLYYPERGGTGNIDTRFVWELS